MEQGMAKHSSSRSREVTALRVGQWLREWNSVEWNDEANRREPEHCFYLFSLPATDLKALCGIYPRSPAGRSRGADDLGIQRRHEKDRSDEISQFVRFGYPWSEMSNAKRESGEFDDLRKPGWLATAIVVNILRPDDERVGQKVDRHDLVNVVSDSNGTATVKLPQSFDGASWQAKHIPPLEVIDGQHRLWAFEGQHLHGEFSLPVVAFYGLDLSWQAYLFYTINIKPKKINASLAFDLYPMLRTEDWLEKFEGHVIYRETRAQELVDTLYSHPRSPWHHRINMVGERGQKGLMVSQAAWIRSLLATFIKSWEGTRHPIGGLFGAPVGGHKQVLPWGRADQAAFLIHAGSCLQEEIAAEKSPWAKALRNQDAPLLFEDSQDLAFFGPNTLVNQDPGVRGFLSVVNDLCYSRADDLDLLKWGRVSNSEQDADEQVSESLSSLRKTQAGDFLEEIAEGLSSYDWRASEAPGLTESERLVKKTFRGSGGYKEIRKQLLEHLGEGKSNVAKAARSTLTALGYD
jgi:DGQHR domain-containing protein